MKRNSERKSLARRNGPVRQRLPLWFLFLCAVATSGCVSSTGGTVRELFAPSPTDVMWQVPEAAFPTQRLYRIHYDGPEGEVSLRMSFYLAARDHYRLDAADSLGRRVWSLTVEPGDKALWLDHRKKQYCRVYAASQQEFVPIAHLPLVSLPNLILGRLPAQPLGDVQQGEGKISYRDAGGQTWNAQQNEEGQLSWWSLLQDGEAVAWWRFADGVSIFSDRRGGQQVRWTEQVREALTLPLATLEVPERYREGICGSQLKTSTP